MAILTAVRTALSACLVGTAILAAPLYAQRATAADVKAAYLFNFTRFVEWPEGALPLGEPFRLCAIADTRTTAAIAQTMQGEPVHGRPSETMTPRSADEARACHMLFVGRSEMAASAPILSAVHDRPVLTISDSAQFIRRGGAIEFVLEEGRVRFDVNLDNARRAGLSISSRLLRVARSVEGQAK